MMPVKQANARAHVVTLAAKLIIGCFCGIFVAVINPGISIA